MPAGEEGAQGLRAGEGGRGEGRGAPSELLESPGAGRFGQWFTGGLAEAVRQGRDSRETRSGFRPGALAARCGSAAVDY